MRASKLGAEPGRVVPRPRLSTSRTAHNDQVKCRGGGGGLKEMTHCTTPAA